MRKRIYSVLPRRSSFSRTLHSATYVDVSSYPQPPPSPPPRPNALATSRIPHTSTSTQQSSSTSPLSLSLALNQPSRPPLLPVFLSPTFPPRSTPPFAHSSPVAQGSTSKKQRYTLDTGAFGIPKKPRTSGASPDDSFTLAVQVGEDSYFVREDGMGVADGVGGYSSRARSRDQQHATAQASGSSASALFSRRLMHFCASELASKASSQHPVDILQKAYEASILSAPAPKENTEGYGSTALLALLDDTMLRVAHLGDCALFLIRPSPLPTTLPSLVYRSDEMQHAFNFPLQLGPSSPTNPREHARLIELEVEPADIVILATDGMSDNLWDEDVLDEVQKFSAATSSTNNPRTFANMLSQALCSRAQRAACSRAMDEESPFARRARESGRTFWGGKSDDISVVVAVVSPSSTAHDR